MDWLWVAIFAIPSFIMHLSEATLYMCVCLFSRPPQAQYTVAEVVLYIEVAVPQSTDPYDTTNWDDEQTHRKH